MERIAKVIVIASKRSIKKLEFNSPYFCKCLNKNVAITNRFYKHISGYSKNRKIIEIIERLSILSLIEEILLKGSIFQERENQFFEKDLFFKKTYKISYMIENIFFIILVGEKKCGENILLSCFVKHLDTKKD